MVPQRAQGAVSRGKDKLRCFGTEWTDRPEEETRPIDGTAKGRVDASGRRAAAWRR